MVQLMKNALIFALALMCFLPTSLAAQIKLKSVHDVVEVELLPGWRMENGQHMAGISIKMLPGWKTYWRAPGDGGIPTTVNWRGSKNLNSAKILWPRPEVFRTYGLRSIGYVDAVVLPVIIRPNSNAPVKVNASMHFGVCEEICLPVQIKLSGMLPSVPGPKDAAIRASLRTLPLTAKQAKVRSATCKFQPSAEGIRLELRLDVPPLAGRSEILSIEPGNKNIWVSEPKTRRNGNIFKASALLVPQAAGTAISRNNLRFTLISTKSSVEIFGCD